MEAVSLNQQTTTRYEPSWQSRQLTGRELQVLTLIGRGMTPKEIATYLNLRIATVGAHRRSHLPKADRSLDLLTSRVVEPCDAWVSRYEEVDYLLPHGHLKPA